VWGLHCLTADEVSTLDAMVDQAIAYAEREGFAQSGDRVVITGGVPLGVTGTTNMLRVAMVGTK
jgi:pyruvate kinase